MAFDTTVLLDGLVFPEGPRWHGGKLWFSDMHTRKVMTVDLTGDVETIVEVPGQPSGLGWLPDGRLLVVSMVDRRLLRLDPEGLAVVADLRELASYHCNDMVVDREGRAYVGNFGFDMFARPFEPAPAEIVLVKPDGEARIVADEMIFPNGSVITPDGAELIVAETFGSRLTAFGIEPDGSLRDRRTWAHLPGMFPDGICLDAEGAIWVAEPGASRQVLRVREGGAVTHRVTATAVPFACMLGGFDRRTLFVLTAETVNPEGARERTSGRIEILQVDVPGAGRP
jgi:sugar lactone lactonase YvrE